MLTHDDLDDWGWRDPDREALGDGERSRSELAARSRRSRASLLSTSQPVNDSPCLLKKDLRAPYWAGSRPRRQLSRFTGETEKVSMCVVRPVPTPEHADIETIQPRKAHASAASATATAAAIRK